MNLVSHDRLRKHGRLPSILLLCAILASGVGCQVLGIPSYRSDMGETWNGETEAVACPPGVLPPLPGCLQRWQNRRKLPDAPDYPRFQPLPTRPIFEPAAHGSGNALVTAYGDVWGGADSPAAVSVPTATHP